MKPSHVLLFGANSFSCGLLAPVLSLVLLAHGASLSTLSLCVGIFAVTVVILELPSGILADLIGRKRIYLFSCAFTMMAYCLFLVSRNFLLLAAACALQGAGRAFSSGSIEALEIESYIEDHGSSGFSKINSSLAIIDSMGTAGGALMGGLLGYLDGSYNLLLTAACILQVFIFLLTLFSVKEQVIREKESSPIKQLKAQLNGLSGTIRGSRLIFSILCISTCLGLGLCLIEIYWQPTLQRYLPATMGWIYGVINCLGYLGVSLGSKAAECWELKQPKGGIDSSRLSMKAYWGLRFLLPICILLLGICSRIWLFLLLFILVYAVLGAGNLLENTMFHSALENSQRASMMSLSSLFLRGGGIITSVLGSLIVTGLDLSFVWLLLPGLMAVFILLLMLFNRQKSRYTKTMASPQ